ncbi:MAG: hypothetical protein AABX24_02865 [Nanoarchaeota archaeon]
MKKAKVLVELFLLLIARAIKNNILFMLGYQFVVPSLKILFLLRSET